MSAMQKLSDANPMSNIIPLDWMEISKALQTLWKREMSDPQRAMQVATDYNRRLFETNMKVWSDAASRFWGLPRQEAEEKGKPDKRFSEPEWNENPYYETLKETYLLASEYLLKEAEETDEGRGKPRNSGPSSSTSSSSWTRWPRPTSSSPTPRPSSASWRRGG